MTRTFSSGSGGFQQPSNLNQTHRNSSFVGSFFPHETSSSSVVSPTLSGMFDFDGKHSPSPSVIKTNSHNGSAGSTGIPWVNAALGLVTSSAGTFFFQIFTYF